MGPGEVRAHLSAKSLGGGGLDLGIVNSSFLSSLKVSTKRGSSTSSVSWLHLFEVWNLGNLGAIRLECAQYRAPREENQSAHYGTE
ncbi:hypothetical protein BH23GEM1_BH23GEM1_00750 [soil metagenome]